jgi:hypothetical protein
MDKSKRGRRPKKQNNEVIEQVVTDTPIIAHLPIELSDICDQTSDIFIKAENIEEPIYNNIQQEQEIKKLKKYVEDLTNKLNKYEKEKQDKPSKPSIIECNNDSNCWWDKIQFTTPAVEMPESYYNGIFSCTGKFCSWECMMAYNIDINDENISKRTSLIYYMYKKTYNKEIIIKPAPSWKILDTFGGPISIEKYRENLNTNTIDYNYIKPPIISRISYVEKIPIKQNIEVIKNDEVILKRSKPLKTTKYNLEHIIGLKVKSSTQS